MIVTIDDNNNNTDNNGLDYHSVHYSFKATAALEQTGGNIEASQRQRAVQPAPHIHAPAVRTLETRRGKILFQGQNSRTALKPSTLWL